MSFFGKLTLEKKFVIIFSSLAFALSFVLGIFSNNPVSVIVMRAFLFTLLFAILSVVSLFVLKKYVPEIYGAVFLNSSETDVTEAEISNVSLSEDDDNASQIEKPAALPDENASDVEQESFQEAQEATETKKPIVQPFVPTSVDSLSSSESIANSKHLEEQSLQFQPKIMAEAVRTMLSKDKE